MQGENYYRGGLEAELTTQLVPRLFSVPIKNNREAANSGGFVFSQPGSLWALGQGAEWCTALPLDRSCILPVWRPTKKLVMPCVLASTGG